MPELDLRLDGEASSIKIHTFAEGLLARLAHDLEIDARATGTAHAGAVTKAELQISAASLTVVGAVKKGQVDRGTLSAADRADIERRIRTDVLAKAPTVNVSVEMNGRRATVRLLAAQAACDVELSEADGATVAAGRVELSLRALGLPTVKGPMGAFKLSDRVEVIFRGVFRPA